MSDHDGWSAKAWWLARIVGRGVALGWLLGFGAVLVVGIFASPAAADNCSAFSDCFGQSEAASEAALGLTALAALSLIVDFIGGRGPLGIGRNPFGNSDPGGWERSLGMLGLTPTRGALELLGVDVVSTGSGPIGALFNHVPGLNGLEAASRVDAWARQAIGSSSANAEGAINHFFGRDVFNGAEWSDFLTTVGNGGLEISSLVPGSPEHWRVMLADRDEMARRYGAYAVGLWEGARGIAVTGYDATSLSPMTPAGLIELHRWNETGEHRGLILLDGLVESGESLSSLNPSSPEFYSELAEVWETRSIAEHDGLNAGGAVIVGIVDWETFSKDPSGWAGRMTVEGIVEVGTGAIPVGAADNVARGAAEAAETAADLAKADNIVRGADGAVVPPARPDNVDARPGDVADPSTPNTTVPTGPETPRTPGQPDEPFESTTRSADDPESPAGGEGEADGSPPAPSDDERIAQLASDPAEGGQVGPKSRQEAVVGAALEADGSLPGPIRRDPSGQAEFIDSNGQQWDVKGFHSEFSNGFDSVESPNLVREEIALGENVIIDTVNMSDEHVRILKQALLEETAKGEVIWYEP